MIEELLSIVTALRGEVAALREEVADLRAAPTFPLITVSTVAPTVTDDSGAGYAVHSLWYDSTGDDTYICKDATIGAAVWASFA